MYGLSVDDNLYHIAIVDDSIVDGERLKELTKAYFKEHPDMKYEICTYQSSGKLLWDLDTDKYFDIYFLDIELQTEQEGMQLAHEIKTRYLEAVLVFVTNHIDFGPQAFEVNAFRYIPKCMLKEKINEAYDYILPRIAQIAQRSYVIESPEGLERILYKNIIYITKDGKYINIHHRGGVSRERKTLAQIMNQLNLPELIYIDKGCIVNIRHIMSVKKEGIGLKENQILKISRPRYKEVKDRVASYWRSL